MLVPVPAEAEVLAKAEDGPLVQLFITALLATLEVSQGAIVR